MSGAVSGPEVDELFVGAVVAVGAVEALGPDELVADGAVVGVGAVGAALAVLVALVDESGCLAVGSGPQPRLAADVPQRQTRTKPEGRMAQVDDNLVAASMGKNVRRSASRSAYAGKPRQRDRAWVHRFVTRRHGCRPEPFAGSLYTAPTVQGARHVQGMERRRDQRDEHRQTVVVRCVRVRHDATQGPTVGLSRLLERLSPLHGAELNRFEGGR